MNQPWHAFKTKNWQWRTIIWSSLFLIFGKELGHWTYRMLGIEQVYSATTAIVNRVGLSDNLQTMEGFRPQAPLVINVKNDTPNDYSIETKEVSGLLDFDGKTFSAGEIKRFVIKPEVNSQRNAGIGDILFTSAPIAGNGNVICQEIHTLNYDMRQVKNIKQPVAVNLSFINSRMNCQETSASVVSIETQQGQLPK